MKNKILLIVGVVVLVFIIVFISMDKTNEKTVRIGALFPLTGGLASYGEPAQRITDIIVEEINAKGGINGKKLEMVYGNHKCDSKEMVTVFEKVFSSGARIFSAVACSGTISSVAPSLVSRDVVLLGTVTSASKLTGIAPNFFRNWASDREEGKVLADQIIKSGYKNVGILFEETDYAKGLKLDVENNLKNSNINLTLESFASGSTDIRTQLTKLKSIKPDVILIAVQTVTTGEIVLTQMEQLNFIPKMLVNYNILKAPALVKAHSSLLEGAFGADYLIKDSADLDRVLALYKEKYGVDCPQKNVCAMQYDAIQMLVQAIREKGDSAKGVKDYLNKVNYQGITGNINFDANNDRSGSDYVLFTIKNGEAVKVTN
jgi:branched-chain amino acid transport system substrate-binding protein